jgi:hypothetical protein
MFVCVVEIESVRVYPCVFVFICVIEIVLTCVFGGKLDIQCGKSEWKWICVLEEGKRTSKQRVNTNHPHG